MNLADNPERILTAFVLASIVSVLAIRVRTLTASGGVAAIVTGTLIVGGISWWAGATLIAFFVTSTALSKILTSRGSVVKQEKGSQRDAVQVVANGGVAATCGLAVLLGGGNGWVFGAMTAIAAATADTWATETGRLTQAPPRSITTLRRVPVGTSGAVSIPGTTASAIGAALIGSLAAAGNAAGWLPLDARWWACLIVVGFAGFGGSILDSLLGATVQERFRCPACGTSTEESHHTCGADTERIQGIAGVTNDVVNLACTAVPAIVVISAILLVNG